MGLAERRATKEFQDQRFPALKLELDAATGQPIPLDVNWESLALDNEAHLYEACWTKVYFQPLVEAIQRVCVDQMGKDALRDGVKKIVVHNAGDNSNGSRWATLAEGVLTLNHKPTTNADDVKDRVDGLVAILEKNL